MADSLVGVMVYYWGTNKLLFSLALRLREGASQIFMSVCDSVNKPM